MPKKDKAGREEEINANLYCIQDVKKMGGKSQRRFRKSLLVLAMVQKHIERNSRFLYDKWRITGIDLSFFSDEKSFTADFVYNK